MMTEAFFVTLNVKPGSTLTDRHAQGAALSGLRQPLLQQGEKRSPSMILDYPDDLAPFEHG